MEEDFKDLEKDISLMLKGINFVKPLTRLHDDLTGAADILRQIHNAKKIRDERFADVAAAEKQFSDARDTMKNETQRAADAVDKLKQQESDLRRDTALLASKFAVKTQELQATFTTSRNEYSKQLQEAQDKTKSSVECLEKELSLASRNFSDQLAGFDARIAEKQEQYDAVVGGLRSMSEKVAGLVG